ncbi:hypothetical protein MVEG_05612 [Podila verticillata NRRL 6337]|nr:hypothetical protein MVEG_05612 [Podila verticillata NRRL 6337]
MPQDYRRAGEALFGREHYARDKACLTVMEELQAREGDWIIIADVDGVVQPSILQTMKYPDPEASPVNAIFAHYSVSQGGSWDLVHAGWDTLSRMGVKFGESVAPTGEETQDYRDNKYLQEGIARENWTLAKQLMRDFHYKHPKFIDDADWHCSWCFSNINQFRTKLDRYCHLEYLYPEMQSQQFIVDKVIQGKDISGSPEDPKLLDSADDISEYVCKNKERFSYMQRRWD